MVNRVTSGKPLGYWLSTLLTIEWNDTDDSVLSRYGRAIVHMRQQARAGLFGIVFGAGASTGLGFPDWPELVTRIATDPDVDGYSIVEQHGDSPLPIQLQILYHHYASRETQIVEDISSNPTDVRRLLNAGWREIVHRALYRNVPHSDSELVALDSVYSHFLPTIRNSRLTVNYNFDDSLQRLLLHARTKKERETGRGYETVTDATLQFRSTDAVIYHPNGYLPRNPLELVDDKLVLGDASFADQLIESLAGQYYALLHHLGKTTALLVGVSLQDETLRHLLRQTARLHPGHFHYYVRYCTDGVPGDPEGEEAAHFHTYNLVTLFLSGEEIASLGKLLEVSDREFRTHCEELGVEDSYTYYLVGVPGVGKTTTLRYFRNLITYDEWLDERHPLMGKPYVELSQEEVTEVDDWIMKQLYLKNRRLYEDAVSETGAAIRVVDRCVPDAIAFTPHDAWPEKAHAIIEAISPGQNRRHVVGGHVILLEGEPREIFVRAKTRHKTGSEDEHYFARLQEDTKRVYGVPTVTPLDVRNQSVTDVVRAVASVIHRDPYRPTDLDELLQRVAEPVKGDEQ